MQAGTLALGASNVLSNATNVSVASGATLNLGGNSDTVATLSLSGTLDVGLISCPDLLPDLWDMADDFRVALDELLDATR